MDTRTSAMRGHAMFEVMTAPGMTRLATLGELGEALGYGHQGSRRDLPECQAGADRLFRAGRSDDWVPYSSAQVVPEHAVCSKVDPCLVIYGSPNASKKPPRNLGFQGVLPELPIRIELMTFSLRVKRSTD